MMKKILSVLLVALLLVTGPALIPATAETMPDFPREYKMFAVKKDGLYVTALDMGFESILTLNEDGTGLMTFDEEIEAVSRWTMTEAEGTVSVFIEMDDGSSAEALMTEGVLELDLFGDGSLVVGYALPEADLSGYQILTLEEYNAQMQASAQAGS